MKRKIIFIAICLTLLILLFISKINNYKVDDSIVFIESRNDESILKGMGFVYKISNNSNFIITNYHVIEDSDKIYVYNNELKMLSADIVDYDIYSDIAILKINDDLGLKEAKISNNFINKKEKVYYYNIGNNKIENGLVIDFNNKINLNTDYGNSFYDAIMVEANFKAGNSGGPIFNKKNEVVGVISLKEETGDKGYCIPIDYAMDIVTKLENNELFRPNLGGMFANSTNKELLNEYGLDSFDIEGVVIIKVNENYPIYISGLIKGDVIAKVNNKRITNVVELQNEIYSNKIGDTITLEYYRNNILNKVDVILNK